MLRIDIDEKSAPPWCARDGRREKRGEKILIMRGGDTTSEFTPNTLQKNYVVRALKR